MSDADYEAGLKKRWRGGLTRLRQLVKDAYIEDHHLQRMADPNQMNVRQVYNKSRSTQPPIDFTLEEMLKSWYNTDLFKLTPEKAQSVLIEVLQSSAVDANHVSLVKNDFAK